MIRMSAPSVQYIMCQLCFGSFEKEQLAPVRGEPGFDYEDVCLRCKAIELYTSMRLWGI